MFARRTVSSIGERAFADGRPIPVAAVSPRPPALLFVAPKATIGAAWLLVAAVFMMLASGCESVSHDNIDRWMTTEKGPGKLEKTLRDSELDPDLRAHAGRNMIQSNEGAKVLQILGEIAEASRQPVIDKLARRLWQDARIEGELTMPSAVQVGAKDALFELRQHATGATLGSIDDNLVDWLTGGYYTARSRQGRIRGEQIMRAIGAKAAAKLLRSAKSIVAQPADSKGRLPKIEDPLLVGLAATGSAEAVDFLLSLINLDRKDKSLPQRTMEALYQAYVANDNRFEVADGKGLVPQLDRLVAMARDETRPVAIVNDAIRLVGAAGSPACIKPLVELIAFPHENEAFLWVSANAALQCGKAQAIVPVVDAIPENGAYEKSKLAGALWEPMAVLGDTSVVAEQARILLESKSWVAKIVGIELLGHLKLGESAAADAERIRQLEGDKTTLRGWWGDQSNVPKSERKAVPRLGERALEVSSELAKLGPGSGK